MRTQQDGLGNDAKPATHEPIPWNGEAEHSEEYKQDRIMAAQHGQVMEETVLNGLRMPSPSPRAKEGRIAAVAKSLRAGSTALRLPTRSRLAADTSLSSHPYQPRGRRRGGHRYWDSKPEDPTSGSSSSTWRNQAWDVGCDSSVEAQLYDKNADCDEIRCVVFSLNSVFPMFFLLQKHCET